MEYIISLCGAFVLLILTLLIMRKKKNRLPWLLGGVAAMLLCLILPFSLDGSFPNIIKGIILSFLQVLQVFSLGMNFQLDLKSFGTLPSGFSWTYILLLAVLYLSAPTLTLGIVLSLFKNVSAQFRWCFSDKRNVVVMSCINERTVILADSMEGKFLCIFCDGESGAQRFAVPHTLQAIVLNEPVSELKTGIFRRSGALTVILGKDDEQENLADALTVIDRMKQESRSRTDPILYVFSTRPEAELVLDGTTNLRERVPGGKIHIRRIDEARALIYDLLSVPESRETGDGKPWSIFDTATEENGKKEIRVLIVGCGHFGREMMKALPWCCVHEEYHLTVNVIEKERIRKQLELQYPGLMFPESLPDRDEIAYKIQVRDETDLFSVDFESPEGRALYGNTGLVAVCLGDDALNLKAAIYLREVFSRMEPGAGPYIMTDVSELGDNIEMRFCGSKKAECDYRLHAIGRKRIYSVKCLMAPEIERFALALHKVWDPSDDNFYAYDYNYRSSMAEALFWLNRKRLGMDVSPSAENMALEHRRWNAYMRSEGFRTAEKKNLLARQHPLIGGAAQEADEIPMKLLEEMHDELST